MLNGLSLINCEEGKAELRLILIQSSLSCNVNASHSSNGWHTVALNAPQVMKFYAVNWYAPLTFHWVVGRNIRLLFDRELNLMFLSPSLSCYHFFLASPSLLKPGEVTHLKYCSTISPEAPRALKHTDSINTCSSLLHRTQSTPQHKLFSV